MAGFPKQQEPDGNGWRAHWYEVIYHSRTKAGQQFDVILLWAILLSVFIVMLETVRELGQIASDFFLYAEWFFTILFTVEFLARIVVVRHPSSYIFSFYGIIDILSILPTYLSVFVPGTQLLLTIRVLRLLRVFRILKLTRFLGESQTLVKSLKASFPKIVVFIGAVLSMCIVLGTVMYMIEGPENGFTSIPRSIYWCIVTLTTVGYGDIAPKTIVGQMLASVIMILGYGIIAVPTGIVSVELGKTERQLRKQTTCDSCGAQGHEPYAKYCKDCGEVLKKYY